MSSINLSPTIGSVTNIIKSHYGQKFNIAEYLDDTKQDVTVVQSHHKTESQPFSVFKSSEKFQHDTVAQYLDETSRYDTDIEDDVRESPSDYLDVSRNVVGTGKVTKNVFSVKPSDSYFPVGEHLTLWVPDEEALTTIFKPRYLERLKRISQKEFKFGGKVFKFLMSKDSRLFARTKNELLSIHDFIDKYKQYRHDEKKLNETSGIDSISYSQMVVEDYV